MRKHKNNKNKMILPFLKLNVFNNQIPTNKVRKSNTVVFNQSASTSFKIKKFRISQTNQKS